MFFKKEFYLLLLVIITFSCSNQNDNPTILNEQEDGNKELTIFHINDIHGSIDNFSKIKYIVDEERKNNNVLFVCGGDTFSGNPVVDNHAEKGYPMIDLMNKVGINAAAIGNHEFDYGEAVLKNRLEQSNFDWLCANINTKNSSIKQPKAYKTITINGVTVTILGLIQTKEGNNGTIPSTHPLRVKNFTFTNYAEIISDYANLKNDENSDLYIALTHLGYSSDISLARKYPYFDIIIGGHSHTSDYREENGTYIYQAGSKLKNIGKIKVTIDKNGAISTKYELINLSDATNLNQSVQEDIETYNHQPELDVVIGYAEASHNRNEVGNFYTEALLKELNADLTFHNSGGIRNTLDKGDITIREIYSIDPFNNGSVTYSMTIKEVKTFLKENGDGFHYAGLTIEQSGNNILIKDKNGNILSNNTSITIGINDFIPIVFKNYFTTIPSVKNYTTAETVINYLNNNSEPVNFTNYSKYFKYQ
ncbi:5'-nucleotidase/hypothetical protein [Lutibacter oricola]|uniref:5'-nucleotidase n=1 Tax=Lutibacter oricola TaxID=762486 RepID=A0A1H3A7X7_9FLAO|nr:bifunctional UDP-sugar hydrolase/5'-nucleotidase [Lutibacter oricola]SDX25274.1 5'-nucleotidase/hypothetical protein [Lutibacter oricola]